VLAIAVVSAALVERHLALGREYARGWDEALLELAKAAPVHEERVTVATKQTDSSAAKVARTAPVVRRRAEAALAALDSAPVPVFADSTPPDTTTRKALQACIALANDCEQLRADVITERSARVSLDSSLKAITVASRDTIRNLSKRPTRKKAILWGAVSAVVGYLLGKQ